MKHKYKERYIVDKTEYISKIIKNSSMLFCARPRTFGKTLVVDMMDDIFQGKREKLKGFFIDKSDYDWKKYPVLRIDFSDCSHVHPEEISQWISDQIVIIGKRYGLTLSRKDNFGINLDFFMANTSALGKKVILIDEYDSLLMHNLLDPEIENIQRVLASFFRCIKAHSEDVRFCFITGVTQFPITSVFSCMNNLTDISYYDGIGCMYGYTQEELEANFADEIEHGIKATGMERSAYLQKVKDWYGGYWFAPGAEQVYNPFSINTFFDSGKGIDFVSNWMQAGNMQLIHDLREKFNFDIIASLAAPITFDDLMSFNVLDMASEKVSRTSLKTLLFQTGFLTIKSVDEAENLYLGIPNKEVEEAFPHLLPYAFPEEQRR